MKVGIDTCMHTLTLTILGKCENVKGASHRPSYLHENLYRVNKLNNYVYNNFIVVINHNPKLLLLFTQQSLL